MGRVSRYCVIGIAVTLAALLCASSAMAVVYVRWHPLEEDADGNS